MTSPRSSLTVQREDNAGEKTKGSESRTPSPVPEPVTAPDTSKKSSEKPGVLVDQISTVDLEPADDDEVNESQPDVEKQRRQNVASFLGRFSRGKGVIWFPVGVAIGIIFLVGIGATIGSVVAIKHYQ
jgi:hypothetical protein